MDMSKKLSDAFEYVKSKVATSKRLENASFTAFLLSLLPIPILSQSAAMIDRIASDANAKRDLESVWNAINKANERIAEQEDSVARIQEIAATVKFNSTIASQLNAILSAITMAIAKENSEWELMTKNWSFQAVLNSLVDVDQASIVAINNSHNLVQNTQIIAKKTQLLADGNSSNVVDRTSFHGKDGSVSMNAIRTQGPIQVEGASIGFGENGMIAFGEGGMVGFGPPQPRPTTANGTCSACNRMITVDIRNGVPSQIQCPYCRAILKT